MTEPKTVLDRTRLSVFGPVRGPRSDLVQSSVQSWSKLAGPNLVVFFLGFGVLFRVKYLKDKNKDHEGRQNNCVRNFFILFYGLYVEFRNIWLNLFGPLVRSQSGLTFFSLILMLFIPVFDL